MVVILTLTLTLTLTPRPAADTKLGLRFETEDGIQIITTVEKKSVAAKAGLKTGMIMYGVNYVRCAF
jgi:predicted metalloprotease with PDZ domain